MYSRRSVAMQKPPGSAGSHCQQIYIYGGQRYVSSKLSNLNLGEDNNEMERPKHFWNRALVAMKFNFEPTWLDATWKVE